MSRIDLQLSALEAHYAKDPRGPERVFRSLHQRIEESPRAIWIYRAPLEASLSSLRGVEERRAAGETLPLFGVPFAVKDNIDVEGLPTTAACPDFSYVAKRSATAVERLVQAGAILVGKTNLDQFATGLVGVRSPYGACANPFDARYIAGGSSCGSAIAVATGLASFALGTDTAGSGRVPAALCNIVGLKPTRGLVSTRGVVPACRSLDCVSIFAGSSRDAQAVLHVIEGFDAADPFSRDISRDQPVSFDPPIRIGILGPEQLEFFGDTEAEALYRAALTRAVALGGALVEIDFQPFRTVASLLYEGPWVAERLEAAGAILASGGSALHPVVRSILERARALTAFDAYRGEYRLRELRRSTDAQLAKTDVLLLPTTPTTYTLEQIFEEPILLNSRLGTYTNFVNLLDLAAVAVPAGFRSDGLPLGVSVIGRSGTDDALLALASRLHAGISATIGTTGVSVMDRQPTLPESDRLLVAVAGAHLRGEPLNHQLTTRGGRFVRACRTAGSYRLFALAGTTPEKPGLVRTPGFSGPGIEVEIWSLEQAAFGSFVDDVPPPLAVGTVLLEDGTSVNGFVCEPFALENAKDITNTGGWRKYLGRPAP